MNEVLKEISQKIEILKRTIHLREESGDKIVDNNELIFSKTQINDIVESFIPKLESEEGNKKEILLSLLSMTEEKSVEIGPEGSKRIEKIRVKVLTDENTKKITALAVVELSK